MASIGYRLLEFQLLFTLKMKLATSELEILELFAKFNKNACAGLYRCGVVVISGYTKEGKITRAIHLQSCVNLGPTSYDVMRGLWAPCLFQLAVS